MGKAGQRRVKDFDIHRMVTQQEELYEEIVAESLESRL
jgi:uncharacterized protein (DUF1810 family)